jgi:hypothetical protein
VSSKEGEDGTKCIIHGQTTRFGTNDDAVGKKTRKNKKEEKIKDAKNRGVARDIQIEYVV